MKRKIYTTARERKIDQLIGFVAFPVLNSVLLIAGWLLAQAAYGLHAPDSVARLCISLPPWIANGIVLVLAFLFRPHIGIGYVAAIAVLLCASVAMGILFLGECFTLCAVAVAGLPSSSNWPPLLSIGLTMIAYVLLLGIGAVALIAWWLSQK